MTLTKLEPKTALVLIDLQKGITRMPTVHPADEVVARASQLAEAFRMQGLPVVRVRLNFAADGADVWRPRADQPRTIGQLPADFSDFPDAFPAHAADLLVFKRHWGAFYGTDLDLQLRRRGTTGLVLAGISTSIGVESTAREAHDRGYHLTVVSDAVTDLHLPSHQHSLGVIFPRIAEVGTTTAVLDLLQSEEVSV